MKDRENGLFRKKTLDRVSSPEQLTDYLRVTNPGIWAILAAVILLMAGLFAWSMLGTLETTVDARVIVQDHFARVITTGGETVVSGMPLRIVSEESTIASVDTDEYGRTIAYAEVVLPDGTYEGSIVVERTRPIDFLLESR